MIDFDHYLDTIRRDTPGCLDKVFLDSAGSSLPPEPVPATMIEHLRPVSRLGRDEWGRPPEVFRLTRPEKPEDVL